MCYLSHWLPAHVLHRLMSFRQHCKAKVSLCASTYSATRELYLIPLQDKLKFETCQTPKILKEVNLQQEWNYNLS